MRMTRQRAAVADVLAGSEEFRSAQQLHDDLRHRGKPVGLATVYRTLQSLAEAGAVDVLRIDDGETLYRHCRRTEHHHHLVCRRCGKTVEIGSETVERWAAQIARDHGFVEAHHTAELFGTCADCAGSGR